jgi:FkbM family methyltransferase
MNRVEGTPLSQTGVGSKMLNSWFADVARGILPEKIKKELRQVARGEIAQYPLPEPVTVNVNGFEGRFWIRNHSDWYRIGAQDFERDFGDSLISTIASMDSPNFVDVGAAQGYYSIMAAKAGAEVVAVDPDPVSQESFIDNLALNSDVAGSLESFNTALGNQNGDITLHIDSSGTYAPSLVRTVRGLTEEIRVPVRTMDNMITSGDIQNPDVVKIDVEGAEALVIGGMKETLNLNQPLHVFVELHRKYLPNFNSTPEEVSNEIINSGYVLEKSWERRSELLCHFRRS